MIYFFLEKHFCASDWNGNCGNCIDAFLTCACVDMVTSNVMFLTVDMVTSNAMFLTVSQCRYGCMKFEFSHCFSLLI